MSQAPHHGGLPESSIREILGVFAHHPRIKNAILYGSRAMGTHRKGSDIDLTLTGDLDHSELLKIKQELDDLLLPYMFDLSLLSEIDNQDLIEHIQRVGQAFYLRDDQPAK